MSMNTNEALNIFNNSEFSPYPWMEQHLIPEIESIDIPLITKYFQDHYVELVTPFYVDDEDNLIVELPSINNFFEELNCDIADILIPKLLPEYLKTIDDFLNVTSKALRGINDQKYWNYYYTFHELKLQIMSKVEEYYKLKNGKKLNSI